MKFIKKEEKNGITTMHYLGGFRISWVECCDMIRGGYKMFLDHDHKYEVYTMDKDENMTPIPDGKTYQVDKSCAACLVGKKASLFGGVKLKFVFYADSRIMTLSFNTDEVKEIMNDNGECLTDEEIFDRCLDLMSLVELYGTCWAETGYTVMSIEKQLRDYVATGEPKMIGKAACGFDIEEILQPLFKNKEEVSE